MRGRKARSTWRNPTPELLCNPQIPQDLTRSRTQVSGIGRRQLTAWRMTRRIFRVTAIGILKKLRDNCISDSSRCFSQNILFRYMYWSSDLLKQKRFQSVYFAFAFYCHLCAIFEPSINQFPDFWAWMTVEGAPAKVVALTVRMYQLPAYHQVPSAASKLHLGIYVSCCHLHS
jgi:hypothetical protein